MDDDTYRMFEERIAKENVTYDDCVAELMESPTSAAILEQYGNSIKKMAEEHPPSHALRLNLAVAPMVLRLWPGMNYVMKVLEECKKEKEEKSDGVLDDGRHNGT